MTPVRTVLITGASAGIGEAFARVFAEHGWQLVVTSRRRERLEALAAGLNERHGVTVHVIVADLADPGAGERIAGEVAAAGLVVDGLVNNAGYAVPGRYRHTSWAQQAAFLQVMVTAVAELTHRFLPGMVDRRYGRIVNVASVAGLIPGSAVGHTLYGASKAFLVRFSQSLTTEVRKHGVHVTAVCPGMTYSEFHDVTGTREKVSRLPKWAWMDAEAVARQGYAACMRGRSVYVTGAANKGLVLLGRLLPDELVMRRAR
jgi:hypothetical protein